MILQNHATAKQEAGNLGVSVPIDCRTSDLQVRIYLIPSSLPFHIPTLPPQNKGEAQVLKPNLERDVLIRKISLRQIKDADDPFGSL